MEIRALGVYLAESDFPLYGVDAEGAVVLRKKLRRGAVLDFLCSLPPCLIGMQACASSHHWARVIAALVHEARLIPPAYGRPYVKRQKNHAADAEAICEAATRPRCLIR
jgi:transposase